MRARGFTLVEVLVALVIVAAGAAVVLSSLNTAVNSTVYLRDKTFAQWVAENRIAETRLATTPPSNGTTEGEVDFAGQRWRWRQKIENAQVPGLRRIDVSVRPSTPGAPPAAPAGDAKDGGDWTVTLAGVLGRDLAGPGATIDWDGQPAPGPGGGGGAGRNGGGGAAGGGATPGGGGGSSDGRSGILGEKT